MAALLDLHPDSTHPALSGVAEVHALLDRMHAGTTQPLASGEHALVVAELDRATRRIEALKFKVIAAADQRRGRDGRWVHRCRCLARQDDHRVPFDAARQVALATELDSGHDATAEALDAGLVSPDHAAVIVRATGQLPDTVPARSSARRSKPRPGGEGGPVQPRPAPPYRAPGDRSRRTRPEDRRCPRERAHPHRRASRPGEVLADPARQRRRHHHGHFTIPALAAAMLGKIIDAMTAPRRMRDRHQHGPVLRLATPPRARVRRAPRALPAQPETEPRRHK